MGLGFRVVGVRGLGLEVVGVGLGACDCRFRLGGFRV